jgi:hypothetical protein
MSDPSSLKDKNVRTSQNNSVPSQNQTVSERPEPNPLMSVAFPKSQEMILEQINFPLFPPQTLSPQNP